MPNPNTIKWTLHPPHGMRFVNEIGGEVTCQFESGLEAELFAALTGQLQTFYTNYLQAEASKNVNISRATLEIDNEGTINAGTRT